MTPSLHNSTTPPFLSRLTRFGVISAAVVSIGIASCWGQGDRGTVAEKYGFGGDESLSPRFRTFYVTWGATEKPDFARYLEEVRPDIVQAGWYGPMFHGYV